MGVYSRKLKKGLRWFYSGQYLGTKYFSKAIYRNVTEAKKAERAKRNEIDEEARNPTRDMRLFDLMEARLDELKLKKSKKYYDENQRYYRMFYQETGDIMASEVKKPQINSFLQKFSKDLASRKKTYHKVNAALKSIRALFNYGNKVYDLGLRNPCNLDYYSVEKRLKYIPTNEEIEAVLKKCDEGQAHLIAFLLETGARIDEALRLAAPDIFEDYVVLYTRKSANSNLVPRKVPKPLWLRREDHSGRVFKDWTFYPEFLKRKVRKLKQPFWNYHNLRHRFASRLSKQGKPLFEIMMLLGHSNLSTTQNYLQLLP